ncbi:MAG: hypothetical protein JNM80_02200 [Phycisphaerae bacterium]|nr:hypothetical protein [Phycisphaerae bacterium]
MARSSLVGSIALVALAGAAFAQPCSPRWVEAPGTPDQGVHALGVFEEAGSPALYIGGWFESVNGVAALRVARFHGGAWSALGEGIPGPFNSQGYMMCCANVHAFAQDAGRVVVGGNYILGGGIELNSIGAWDGTLWHSMAGGVAMPPACQDCAPVVHSFARFGGELHAAGTFDLAGGSVVNRVARWTGSSWLPLGSGIGVTATDPFPAWVYSMTPWAGSLYAVGRFSRAGEVETSCVARWDGASWHDVGGGLRTPEGGRHPTLAACAVYDSGHGPELYVAGILDIAGETMARNIARWDGSSWRDVGGGVGSGVNDRVWALAVFDDGRGPALFAAGEFEDAGGAPASNIARWDGQAWSALGAGVDGAVQALVPFDDGSGPRLLVGGWFTRAGGAPSAFLAAWAGCPATCYANCDASTAPPVLNVADFVCFLNHFAAEDSRANCDASTAPPVLNVADFVCFLNAFAAGCP